MSAPKSAPLPETTGRKVRGTAGDGAATSLALAFLQVWALLATLDICHYGRNVLLSFLVFQAPLTVFAIWTKRKPMVTGQLIVCGCLALLLTTCYGLVRQLSSCS